MAAHSSHTSHHGRTPSNRVRNDAGLEGSNPSSMERAIHFKSKRAEDSSTFSNHNGQTGNPSHPNLWLSQAISWHGVFGKYLLDYCRRSTSMCAFTDMKKKHLTSSSRSACSTQRIASEPGRR